MVPVTVARCLSILFCEAEEEPGVSPTSTGNACLLYHYVRLGCRAASLGYGELT